MSLIGLQMVVRPVPIMNSQLEAAICVDHGIRDPAAGWTQNGPAT